MQRKIKKFSAKRKIDKAKKDTLHCVTVNGPRHLRHLKNNAIRQVYEEAIHEKERISHNPRISAKQRAIKAGLIVKAGQDKAQQIKKTAKKIPESKKIKKELSAVTSKTKKPITKKPITLTLKEANAWIGGKEKIAKKDMVLLKKQLINGHIYSKNYLRKLLGMRERIQERMKKGHIPLGLVEGVEQHVLQGLKKNTTAKHLEEEDTATNLVSLLLKAKPTPDQLRIIGEIVLPKIDMDTYYWESVEAIQQSIAQKKSAKEMIVLWKPIMEIMLKAKERTGLVYMDVLPEIFSLRMNSGQVWRTGTKINQLTKAIKKGNPGKLTRKEIQKLILRTAK